jgi:hypothetical protein
VDDNEDEEEEDDDDDDVSGEDWLGSYDKTLCWQVADIVTLI